MCENGRTHSIFRIDKIIAGVLCVIFLLNIIRPLAAFAAEFPARTVRVGYVWSTNFSEGESDEEYKSGYAYEYLQKIAYYTGWEYEYVYGDWSTIFEMLVNGEVDVMAGVSYTEERSHVMNFPDYPMGAENYYIYVWQNSELAGLDASGFNGLTIGCTEGSMQNVFLESWNEEAGNHCTIKKFNGNSDLYKALVAHTIDAVVDTDNAILPSDGLVPVTKVGSSDYYLAVSKDAEDAEDVLAELNEALEEIDRFSPYYLQDLHNKYFSETAVIMTLSAPEKEWLAAHSVIRVGCMNNYMPYCGVDENGHITGVLTDVFDHLFDNLAIEKPPLIEYVNFDDQKDLIAAVNDGSVDVAFPVYGDIWFSEVQGIFQTADITDILVNLVFKGDYNDLTINRIGVNRKNLIQYQYTVKQYPDAEIVYYDSINECLDAVVKGEIDCTVTNGLRTDALTGKSFYDSLNSIELSDPFQLSMGVKRGETGLLTLLNHGLNTLDKNYVLTNAYKYQVRSMFILPKILFGKTLSG